MTKQEAHLQTLLCTDWLSTECISNRGAEQTMVLFHKQPTVRLRPQTLQSISFTYAVQVANTSDDTQHLTDRQDLLKDLKSSVLVNVMDNIII